jgi:hypothetical protein
MALSRPFKNLQRAGQMGDVEFGECTSTHTLYEQVSCYWCVGAYRPRLPHLAACSAQRLRYLQGERTYGRVQGVRSLTASKEFHPPTDMLVRRRGDTGQAWGHRQSPTCDALRRV